MTDLNTTRMDNAFRISRVAAPLRASVAEAIRSAIAVGRFQPGERLQERILCEMTGVSRTVVREVLRQLEAEGLVQVLAHRGPIVARLGALEAQGVYQVRAELEGLAAELFTEHATLEQKRALERGFVELEKAVNGKDQLAIFAARRSFYDSLVDGSGNLALAQTLQALNSRMTVLRASALSALSQSNESLQDLRRLVDAVFEMDKDKARQAARDHVANVAALTIRFLVEREVSANSKEPSRRTG